MLQHFEMQLELGNLTPTNITMSSELVRNCINGIGGISIRCSYFLLTLYLLLDRVGEHSLVIMDDLY